MQNKFKNLTVVDHPLVQHKIAAIRSVDTGTKEFRSLLLEITRLIGFEAFKTLPTKEISVQTPLVKTKANVLLDSHPVLVPILRAGLGMVEGMLELAPDAFVGHIGLFREHDTLKPVEYYAKIPEAARGGFVVLLDPMLATGGSAVAALKHIKQFAPRHITLMNLIACPEGVLSVNEAYPEVRVVTGALDERLNDKGYILPGLGDAGDRLFGTL